jgi:hypothetical protein
MKASLLTATRSSVVEIDVAVLVTIPAWGIAAAQAQPDR